MPSKEERSLIQLDKNLIITLPKAWTEFFKMKKGKRLPVIYDSIFIILPKKDKKLEKKVREFFFKD